MLRVVDDFPGISLLKTQIAKKEKVSEEDVRQTFNFDLKNYVKGKYGVDFNFKNEESMSLDGGKVGRLDSRSGSLIIEYKKPGVSLEKEQKEQLLKYLESSNYPNAWGVLTNGIEAEIYQYSDEEQGFTINESYSGEVNKIQLDYISDIIAKKDNIIINSNNVNDILGIEKHSEIIRRIYELLDSSSNVKTKLLYSEWQKLFNLSSETDFSNDENRKIIRQYYKELLNKKIDTTDKEYKVLFSIQTYYSVVLKLLLVKLISDERNIKFTKYQNIKDFFIDIENNKIYRKLNISNLVDGDFFSWYLNEFEDKDFQYFYDEINQISSVESNGVNLMMIHFYENVFPFHVRHAMGEFYTPNFLANKVVNKVIDLYIDDNGDKPKSILDPCCGSGIFVLNSLKHTDEVYGIDINPIAVLTAKINFLLNTSLTPKEMLEIPIYLGDSTYFPRLEEVNGIQCYTYDLITSIKDNTIIPFTFPIDVVNMDNFFRVLDEIEMYVKDLNKQGLINLILSYPEFHYEDLVEHYDNFINILLELEKEKLNSIWLKIIGNYLKTGSLVNMDAIVGNPPWVRWGNLPDNYREKIKTTCRIDGIFSRDKNSGGVDLNIAALICFISIRDRLNKKGILGFLMPDSVLFNKSYEGFRNYQLNEEDYYYLVNVERWNKPSEKPFDPVTLSFGEYYFSFTKPEEIIVFDRKDNINKRAFRKDDSFNNHYSIVTEHEMNEIKKVLGQNKLKFRSGISLIKGGHYMLNFVKTVTEKTSLFQTYESKNNRIRLSSNMVELENEIVYPFINAPQIDDNYITKTDLYCIFPYPYGSKEPYSLNEIRTRFPLFYNYFMRDYIQESINSSSTFNKRIQNNKFDVGIFRVGDYTYGKEFLICRDNTKSSFAKVSWIDVPWGERKLPLFDGHVNYVDHLEFKKKYNKEFTKDIKDKLFDIFTQEGVRYYIKASSDSRSISSRLYNDIKIDFL